MTITPSEPQGLENQLRAQIKALWATVLILAAALVGAIVTLAFLVPDLFGQESALRAHALHSCETTNITRAQDNRSHLADYGVFLFVDKRFSIPTPTETPAQLRITREFASTLRASLQAKTWATLTDCTAAHGNLAIETFSIAQKQPPASQMSVSNASRPDPAGSTP